MKITDAGYRPLRRGHAGDHPPGIAVGRRQPLHRPRASRPPTTGEDPATAASSTRPTRRRRSTSTSSSTPSTRRRARRSAASIRGYAASYQGRAPRPTPAAAYLEPLAGRLDRLFEELNSDTPTLKRFIVASSQLVGDLAARRARPRRPRRPPRDHDHRDRPPEAGARHRDRRPARLHAPRRHDLRQPARDARRPQAARRRVQARRQEAAALLRRSCARWPSDARPTLRDLSALIRSPGADNDLIELTKSAVPLRRHRRRPDQAQRQEARGRASRVDQRAQAGDARAGHARPYARRPDRLVRRLQPLGRLRRARRRQPRGAARQRCSRTVNGVLKPLLDPVCREQTRSSTPRRCDQR